jgi:small conductance mechanosensitive channel
MPAVLLAASGGNQQDGKVSSWFDRHGEALVVTPIRILVIVVVALILRAITRKMITQLISKMANDGGNGSGRPVTGFLLNAERRRQRAETVGSVMRSMASFVILGIATLLVLSELNVNLAPLLASAGIAGVAIGFGRNLVTDFLSGMFMILEDQYGVGDLVDAGPASGTVIEVGLRITKLRDSDGTVWYIRNGEIKRIGNRSQGWGTAKVDVQVGYREDADKVRDLIVSTTEALADDEHWDEMVWGPGEVIGMESVSPESVVLQVQVKTMPGQEKPVARELRARLKHAFDDAGVRLTEPTVAAPPAETNGDTGGAATPAAEPLPPAHPAPPAHPPTP